jgi:uncharacterized protein (DUF1697 family)
MTTYIAFLRGINVGGKNKVPMLELRQALENANFKNVRTYIQSGNVVLDSTLVSTDAISVTIGKTILDTFGFDIPVLVKTRKQVEVIISDTPYGDEELISNNKTYFVLLFESPPQQLQAIFKAMNFPNEAFQITESCIHLMCFNGYGKAKLSSKLIETKLNVIATARNYRTMQNILALAK